MTFFRCELYIVVASTEVVKKFCQFFLASGPDLPRWWLHLIVVRRFEYASDPESYTSGSVATGRVSLAGQVKG